MCALHSHPQFKVWVQLRRRRSARVASFVATRSTKFPTYRSPLMLPNEKDGTQCHVSNEVGKVWTNALEWLGVELMMSCLPISTVLLTAPNCVYESAVVHGRVCGDYWRRVSQVKKHDWYHEDRRFCFRAANLVGGFMLNSSLVSTVLQTAVNSEFVSTVERRRVSGVGWCCASRATKHDWHRKVRKFCLGRYAFS